MSELKSHLNKLSFTAAYLPDSQELACNYKSGYSTRAAKAPKGKAAGSYTVLSHSH